MKIAVNTRLLIPNKLDGIGWFTYEALRRLTGSHPEHEFIFIFDRPYDPKFVFSENVTPVTVFPPARHPVLWWTWFECSLPFVLRKHRPDVFLSPDGYLSLKTSVPSIAVIHDINFEHYPEQLPPMVRSYYRHFFPKFARKADRIVTVSSFSKDDIAAKYGISPENIDVAYNGVSGMYYQRVDEQKMKEIRNEYTGGEEYFIFVGTLHPRKNLQRLLLAFDHFRNETGKEIKLLIVGRRMWWTEDMEETYQSLVFKKEVVFTGRIDPPGKLRDLVATALAMIYVPVFEGFGIPVIEAQAAGVPVVASNTSSLPEIAGDGALLCDPFSVDAIKQAMKKIINDHRLRNKLIQTGRKNAKRFSWEATADQLWQTITKTVKSK